jgi:uncharacterized lipoprotein YmbA
MNVRRLLALLLLLGGCGFFSRTKSTFYSLDPIPPAGAIRPVSGLPVAVDVVELPPGFDRRDMIVRKADRQLDVRETQQWSASLEPAVLHTLAFDLASRLPEGMVILPGQVAPAGPKRGIDLVVEDFSAGPENTVVLDARWVLRQGAQEQSHHERITIDITALDGKNIADGYSRAIAALADRIVAAL